MGSPQIRNTGTIGGNLATASPAGDTLPVLFALGARVEVASAAGARTVPVAELVVGPKRNALGPGELVTAVRVPSGAGPAGVPQGRRAQRHGHRHRQLRAGRRPRPPPGGLRPRIGGAGAGARHAVEMWLTARIDWDGHRLAHQSVVEGFGRRMAAACQPIDDHRAPAGYRRYAIEILARRALERVWGEP